MKGCLQVKVETNPVCKKKGGDYRNTIYENHEFIMIIFLKIEKNDKNSSHH